MRKKRILGVLAGTLLAGAAVVTTGVSFASDHDDGEPTSTTAKNRNLNLTDHFAFKSPATPTEMSIITYTNPRSLAGKTYTLATNARYEQHISKVADKTATPTASEDFVFRYEFGPPAADGVQPITLTVLKDGASAGTITGSTTAFAASKAGSITTNTGDAGTVAGIKFFVGARADSFTFDVIRFFQVRAFLADRFFGGTGGVGDPTAVARLAPNCKGQTILQGVLGSGDTTDGDVVNLFNPASCAPDFTKNYNVTAIVTNVPIANLGGGTVFDTWSTISVLQ